jgi:Ala-tRNA(Pro) deacylase
MAVAEKTPIDKAIISALNKEKISFLVYQHPAFTSCELSAAWHKENKQTGLRVKNLFLRNKNGKQHFLLMLPHKFDFDKARFKEISGQKCGLASEDRLWETLHTKPGAVSPLSLLYDTSHTVTLFIETSLLQAALLHVHPGTSQASVALSPDALLHALKAWGHAPQMMEWNASSSDD